MEMIILLIVIIIILILPTDITHEKINLYKDKDSYLSMFFYK